MKNLAYKIKFAVPNFWLFLWKTFLNFSSIIGGFYTVYEISDAVFGYGFPTFFRNHFCCFCICAIIVSSIISIQLLPKCEFTIKDYDIKVKLKVDCIENRKKSIIIPTNSCFVTNMKDGIISLDSVQGAYQKKYYKKKLDELDGKLKNQLQNIKAKEKEKILVKGVKYNIYDIGTVVNLYERNRNVYFLAVNHINKYGQNKNRNINDVYISIDRLWNWLSENGHVEDEISIPLIGSGHAGIAEATKGEILRLIIDSFVAHIRNSHCKITDCLTIVIHPCDVEKININEIKKYIEYSCIFAKRNNSKIIGKEIVG